MKKSTWKIAAIVGGIIACPMVNAQETSKGQVIAGQVKSSRAMTMTPLIDQ